MSNFHRLLPRPRLSVFLLLIWLLLNNSFTFSTIFFGVIIAWLIPLVSYQFWPEPRPPMRYRLLLVYALRVIKDIVLASITVARLILGSPRNLKPAFVNFPLELEDSFAITMLASTVSLTPGTVSSDISADRKFLLIHALDVDDEEALIEAIKTRYETPLREIFR